MTEHRCDYCQQLGSLVTGRQDRLLVARVVDLMPPLYRIEPMADLRPNEPLLPGKIFRLDDMTVTTWHLTPPLRHMLTVHLKCIPSWLDEHPELALTSSKPSDV